MALFKKKDKKKEQEEKPQKKPLEIWYTEDGTKIGDDGYPMTQLRTKMHNIWNGYFIYAIFLLIWGSCLHTDRLVLWRNLHRLGATRNRWLGIQRIPCGDVGSC